MIVCFDAVLRSGIHLISFRGSIYQPDAGGSCVLSMQISLPGVPVRSGDLLDFVVVGGGIAGIASAWSLRAAGHRVSLLEQRPSHVLSEVCHLSAPSRPAHPPQCRQGMRVIPSMTQVLNDWGIGDRLASIAAPHGKVAFVDGLSRPSPVCPRYIAPQASPAKNSVSSSWTARP